MREHPVKLVNEPVVHSLYCGHKAMGDNNRHGSTVYISVNISDRVIDCAVLRMRITKRWEAHKQSM